METSARLRARLSLEILESREVLHQAPMGFLATPHGVSGLVALHEARPYRFEATHQERIGTGEGAEGYGGSEVVARPAFDDREDFRIGQAEGPGVSSIGPVEGDVLGVGNQDGPQQESKGVESDPWALSPLPRIGQETSRAFGPLVLGLDLGVLNRLAANQAGSAGDIGVGAAGERLPVTSKVTEVERLLNDQLLPGRFLQTSSVSRQGSGSPFLSPDTSSVPRLRGYWLETRPTVQGEIRRRAEGIPAEKDARPATPPQPQHNDLVVGGFPFDLAGLENAVRELLALNPVSGGESLALLRWVGLGSGLLGAILAYAVARQQCCLPAPALRGVDVSGLPTGDEEERP
jgi:hypothetical protein